MPNKYLPALLAALIFCGCTAANQPNKNTCSQKLHKAENRDDLIKQMYQTGFLDECLYQYTPEQLTAIWQIPVIFQKDDSDNAGDDAPFGLYVVHQPLNEYQRPMFYIRMNQTAMNQVGSIFPEGYFPDVLPKPDFIEQYADNFAPSTFRPRIHPTVYRDKPGDQIQHGTKYFWVNGYRIISTGIYPHGAIISFNFYKDGRIYTPSELRNKYRFFK
ncbi:hypothetical protein LVJ77_08625 [Conchiformibius kuhniae]|uniref:Lipoprotein n=1 Tax=Conchiformibius kuhniae TaxID=211502 RepID=A0A8T9MV72_9NEIS|nr:hypothetical protein LVJ77_08615 [Conchiformibius kuhniae]UOP04388.1 hypothetical protein LVJ77_08625 [Conchiformibius kuhniae]